MLTGRVVDADEALAMGLANRVCPPGEAVTIATALARDVIWHPRTTMLADRAGVHAAFDLPFDEALLAEHDRGVAAIEAGGMADVARFGAGEGRHGQA